MTVTQVNDYNDYNNKIKTMTLSAGNVTRMVASYSYDDIGRLISLKRSGNVGMVNYAYNIRNWLNETKSDFIFEDGKLDKYLFDGGYCSFDNNQNPTFHYYEKDHLGSVRMVVNEKGTIEPSHTFGVVGYVKEFDPYFNQVVSYPVFGKNNTELEEQINIVEQ